jgi:GNAT superfamily N-acetyltransferase
MKFSREKPLPYQIRVATETDHQAISALITPLVEQFIAPDCSAEGTALLLGSMQPQAILNYLHGDFRYWLAEDAQGLTGVVAIKGRNHLYHLFVAARAQGQGLAKQLWQHALAQCALVDAPDEFTVNASLHAEQMYRHFGFVAEQGPRERMGIVDVPMRLILRPRFAGDAQ